MKQTICYQVKTPLRTDIDNIIPQHETIFILNAYILSVKCFLQTPLCCNVNAGVVSTFFAQGQRDPIQGVPPYPCTFTFGLRLPYILYPDPSVFLIILFNALNRHFSIIHQPENWKLPAHPSTTFHEAFLSTIISPLPDVALKNNIRTGEVAYIQWSNASLPLLPIFFLPYYYYS